MSGLRRLLPHPVVSTSLLVIWLVLNASVQPGQILLGALFGLVVPLLVNPLWPDPRRCTACRGSGDCSWSSTGTS